MLWLTWMAANTTMWMNDVAAAWLMTSIAPSPLYVALVQSAVDASNKAYKGMSMASRQLSDTLTANATKVGETVTQSPTSALAKIEV